MQAINAGLGIKSIVHRVGDGARWIANQVKYFFPCNEKKKPNVTTAWHRLKGIAERYCITSGTGRVEIGTLPPHDVHPGDIVIIPPMCRQRITNIGQDDLVFLAICTPRFTNEAYEDIEGNMNDQ